MKVQQAVTVTEETGRERFGTVETAVADKENGRGKEQELYKLAKKDRRKAICVVRARQERTGILYSDRKLITKPEEILAGFGRLFDRAGVEQLFAVSLTKRGEPVAVQLIALGGVDSCMVSVAEIMKLVLLSNCPCFLLIHNHPSGNVEPSREDKAITERVERAAEIMGLQLMDHLIIGDLRNGYSIKYEHEVHLLEPDPAETGIRRTNNVQEDGREQKACREKKGA